MAIAGPPSSVIESVFPRFGEPDVFQWKCIASSGVIITGLLCSFPYDRHCSPLPSLTLSCMKSC